MLLFDSGHQYN